MTHRNAVSASTPTLAEAFDVANEYVSAGLASSYEIVERACPIYGGTEFLISFARSA